MNMGQLKNEVKIDGNKNHISQGSRISSKADIKGDKNDVNQGISSSSPAKVNGWTKAQIICAVITVILGILGFFFTYI